MLPTDDKRRSRLTATFVSTAAMALVLTFGSAHAQSRDESQPREIPEGFVLPGPPPVNAPEAGETAPEQPEASEPADPPAAAAGESGQNSGSGVTSAGGVTPQGQNTVVGTGQTTTNPMAFATAPEPGTTNWPCVQRKVDVISTAQVWAGPSLPEPDSVELTADMRELIDTVAARRLPLSEAEAMVKEFLDSLPEAEREAKATALFSALLDRFNTERSQIMRGIERYGAKQKALAAKLREMSVEFGTLQRNPTANPTQLDEARQALLWDKRIFDERRQSLTYVCEVPTLIEQRAFALGRAVQRAL
ncbi:hypothetical protein [Jiella marina]|uniref:hypothetical protein n=1 Tax=Jiella sp. LLJ827 TaxID=2917712 RepID=UPI00210152ED|nr:hypothetical protein [Jiella sp. LLJ827]MCQ0987633.1 hypothetical protein [Jiella sp. LLJ827]